MANDQFSPEEIKAFQEYDAAQPKEFSEDELQAFRDYDAQVADQAHAAAGEKQDSPVLAGILGGSIPLAASVGHHAIKAVPTAGNIAREQAKFAPKVSASPKDFISPDPMSEHGFHPGAASNAEFNEQQRLANTLRSNLHENPIPGFEVPGNSRLILPTGTQVPEPVKPSIPKRPPMAVVNAGVRSATNNPVTQLGTRVAGGYGMGSNAKEAYDRLHGDQSTRNKIAGYLNAIGAGTGAAAMAVPEKFAKVRLPLAASSGALEWIANKVADQNKKAGGGRIGALESIAEPVIKKLSEVLGDVGAEGKNLATTQSDRTIVGLGQKGGPGFPGLQHTDPEHAAANAVWGVGDIGTANQMVNANKRDPQGGLIWTNYVGGKNQHSSNPMVLGEMMDAFNNAVKQGKLSPELYKKINSRLSSGVTGNLFDPAVDILDPAFLKSADTFEKRRLVGDVLGGEGVGKTKGQIIPYQDIMNKYTDPAFIDQPTGVMGNRLFTLDNSVTHNPNIHEGFPKILGGKDLNVQYDPVPANIGMRDFVANKINQKNAKGVKPVMGTYDWIRGTPTQPVTEDYLTYLQKEGHAEGGSISPSKKSPDALKDYFSGKTSLSQALSQAGHELTHFPKPSSMKVPLSMEDPGVQAAMQFAPMGLGVVKNVGGNWAPNTLETYLHHNVTEGRSPEVKNWYDTILKKYIQNRMGTPEDEIRKLADQGVTHITSDSPVNYHPNARIGLSRSAEGFPEEGMATTAAGHNWENASDRALTTTPASWGNPDAFPWLNKLDPNTPLYTMNPDAGSLGFHKIGDMLESDINAGKLTPEQLAQMSVEKAVRRTHGARENQMAQAQKAQETLPVTKTYPSGYKWHELTHQDPETLKGILKKEGETMQNCISGYCDDVLEDGTKLYSLRDPAGNPHANVEVIQNRDGTPMIKQIKGKQNAAPSSDYQPYVQDFVRNPHTGNQFSVVGDLENTGLMDVNSIKNHGVIPSENSARNQILKEISRIHPSEISPYGGSIGAGQFGTKMNSYDLLPNLVSDIPNKYITSDELLSHLQSKEPRPVEESYSKYYEQPTGMAGGGKVGSIESLLEAAPKLYQGAKDLILPPAENAARTQIIGTLPTYQKASDMFQKLGATGKPLDFGAGLGEGAKIMDADTFEPYAKNWNPTYTNAADIPSDMYGKLTNLNVLNVMPREMRDQTVSDIGRVMDKGGLGILTTRGNDVMKAQGRPGPEPTSIITSRDTYQKGFSPQELEEYLKYILGNKFDINKLNLGPAGALIRKK